MIKKNRIIYGIGINDAEYVTQKTVNGKVVMCHFYRTWKNAIERCYSEKRQASHPAYIGCSVCEEWLTFSNFKAWMERQDWQGKELDKDILVKGNKVYSPETCVFVDRLTNSFAVDIGSPKGSRPIGVNWDNSRKKFQARCSNPFTKKSESLGRYTCADEAHNAWLKRKHEIACQLADLQTDSRVANALRLLYNEK